MAELFTTKNTPLSKSKTLVTGFTLMEVIVGLIILAVVFGGIISAFVSVKRYVSRATRRVVSTNLNKQFLNSLYKDVRADTWDNATAALAPGVHDTTNIEIDNFSYGSASNPNNYEVQTVPGKDYRQVNVTISYPTN
jgi:prepilin-type N-terminal cleavage/methylation domain-containing protein